MRIDLITEELDELQTALDEEDIVEVADALADLLYVVAGAGLVFGIDLDAVLQEVHRSNMSKLHHVTGQPIYRADGKVLKGENFSEPDIGKVLHRQIMDHQFANRTITNLDAGQIGFGEISSDGVTENRITTNQIIGRHKKESVVDWLKNNVISPPPPKPQNGDDGKWNLRNMV